MNYTAKYVDENGKEKKVSITDEDSEEAMKNDYEEIQRKYNPKYVCIRRVQAKPGEKMHLKVTVNAPTHYLTASNDISPKNCKSMTVDIICFAGYPMVRVSASYAPDYYLASPNVFRSGAACIDNWIPFTSSLITVVDKLVHDMIHDSTVNLYNSVANDSVVEWHKKNVEAGAFPTIDPKLLYAPEVIPLPHRRTETESVPKHPRLPERSH